MGHSKTLIALLFVLLAAPGCASVRYTLQKTFRQPGERLGSFPDVVWLEHDCQAKKLPYFIIEENELMPPRVRAGGEFSHRLIYAMCPSRPTEVVEGSLSTRIRFKGSPIFGETTTGYEIKPGRWVLDSRVELPEDVEQGVYAYEVSFRGGKITFNKISTFIVGSY